MKEEKTLLLIDSYALIFRAFYAFPPTLTDKNGVQINAVYGFASLLLEVLLKFKPTHVIAIMDSDKPTIRSQDYTQYKANRKETPEGFSIQIPKVKELLDRFDIPTLSVDGYEADDVIATIDNIHSGKWAKTIVVTGDKDLFQLVDEDTFVYLAGSSFSQSKLYNFEMVKEKMGVTPNQIPDYKGLSGDPSDNIPGVAGIGPKSAVELLNKYETLDNIYKNIEDVLPRYKNKLLENYETAIMSKNLATVVKEVPIVFEFEKCFFPTFSAGHLKDYFEELRFKSLTVRLDTLVNAYSMASVNEESLIEDDLIDIIPWTKNSELADESFIYCEFKEGQNSLDIDFVKVFILSAGKIYTLSINDLVQFSKEIKNKKFYVFDLKKILNCFLNNNLEIDINQFEDLGILAVLMSKGKCNYSLKNILDLYSIKYSNNSVSMLLSLNKLKDLLTDSVEIDSLYQIERSVINVVIEMEREGILLDVNQLQKDKEVIVKSIQSYVQQIYKEVGHEFNINSPKQLSSILFQERGLRSPKKTKSGGQSTNEAALVQMKGIDPLIDMILGYRGLEKIRSTYLESLPDYVYAKTGKVHATFDQFGAISGRFSSKNPNMQNIPKGLIDGINIRDLFISSKDKTFVGVDYSQQELRILAAVAQEETMLNAFNQGEDIHKITASELFNIPIESVTKEQRGVGKTINFSVIYGISAFALSERLGIDRATAAMFIDKYYKKYPNIKKYMDLVLDNAKKTGYTQTIMGRKREELNINSSNKMLQSAAERELFNFIIQGSAADLMKLCMTNFSEALKKYSAKLLLQVHDEFLFELPKDADISGFANQVKEIMLNVKDIGVKYDVDLRAGDRWGSMSELKL